MALIGLWESVEYLKNANKVEEIASPCGLYINWEIYACCDLDVRKCLCIYVFKIAIV